MSATDGKRKLAALKWIGVIVTIASVIFVVITLARMDVDWSRLMSGATFVWLLPMVLAAVVQIVLLGIAWKLLLEFTGQKMVPLKQALSVYCRSNLIKYLPGNVMHYAGRNLLGMRLGIKQSAIALSSVLEIVLVAVTGVVIVIIFAFEQAMSVALMVWKNDAYRTIFLIVGACGVALLIAVALLLVKRRNLWGKYKFIFSVAFLKTIWKVAILHVVSLTLFGLILAMVYALVLRIPLSGNELIVVMAFAVLSWLAGFIVPGAPGGVGIRESICMLLLGPMYGLESAALAAVIARFASVIGDVLAFLPTLIIKQRDTQAEQLTDKEICWCSRKGIITTNTRQRIRSNDHL